MKRLHGLAAAEPYFGVLVGGNCSEGRLWEGEHLEDTPADTEQVICLDDVEAWMVSMHRVQNDLQILKAQRLPSHTPVSAESTTIISHQYLHDRAGRACYW